MILVRLKTSGGGALFDLSAKFGAEPDQAATLLQAVVRAGCRPGLAFHVGSQCTEPQAYRDSLALSGEVVEHGEDLLGDHLFWSATGAVALVICLLATLYPSYRAARLDPVTGLHGARS